MEKNILFGIIVAVVLIVSIGLITVFANKLSNSEDISTYTELDDVSLDVEPVVDLEAQREERLREIQTLVTAHQRSMLSLIGRYEREIVEIKERQNGTKQFNQGNTNPSQIGDLITSTDNCAQLLSAADDEVQEFKKDENKAEDDVRSQNRVVQVAQDRLNQALVTNASNSTIDSLTNDLEDAEDERDSLREDERNAARDRELAEDKYDEIQDNCREEQRKALLARVTQFTDSPTCTDALKIAQDSRSDADDDIDDAKKDVDDEKRDLSTAQTSLQSARDSLNSAIQQSLPQDEIDLRQRLVDQRENDVEDQEDDLEEAEDRLDIDKRQLNDIADLITELRNKCRRFV